MLFKTGKCVQLYMVTLCFAKDQKAYVEILDFAYPYKNI